MEQFAHQAPTLIVALSSPVENSKIPLWEQELSAGAACMNLLHAATALGFGGGWLTGWPSYNTTVRDAFGKQHEKIAGFLFLGTPSRSLEERPRPDYDDRVSAWTIWCRCKGLGWRFVVDATRCIDRKSTRLHSSH